MLETKYVMPFVIVVGTVLTLMVARRFLDRSRNQDAAESVTRDNGLPARQSWQSRHWYMVSVALHLAAEDLAKLKPPVLDALHVGASDEDPGNCRITLEVYTEHNLTDDQKVTVIDSARPIIERHLLAQDYDPHEIAQFEYGVMYANSERNMVVVGEALAAIKSKLASLKPSVVSTYHLGPFSGEPGDFCIYLCFDSDFAPDSMEVLDVKQAAKKLLESELLRREYAAADLATFSYELVSKRELENAGGWALYLR
jgi:hypothetical protein